MVLSRMDEAPLVEEIEKFATVDLIKREIDAEMTHPGLPVMYLHPAIDQICLVLLARTYRALLC